MIHKHAIIFVFIAYYAQAQVIEKPIVIIVPSRNNNELFEGKERYKLNLDSIFSQDYSNYRVIYIDDCSTDGTADAVERYVQEKGQSDRVTLIKNIRRWGPSRNRYIGTHLCDDNEIVMYLDGDDWFAHSSVLRIINCAYDDPDIWLTYSHFRHAPDDGTLSGGIEIPSWVISQNAYRKYGWHYHSLKTFYAWLAKRVKLEDLLYEGNFLPIASDMIETFPLVEMSDGRFKFIEDVLYIASVHPTNEMNIAGWDLFQIIYQYIVTREPYQPIIQKPAPQPIARNGSVDVLLFCQSSPDELSDSLEDLQSCVTGIHNLYIIIDDTASKDAIYNAIADSKQRGIREIRENIKVKHIHNLHDQDFLLSLADHLMLTSQDIMPCKPIDLKEASLYLDKTYAYTFYFSKNAHELEERYNVPCFHMLFDFDEHERIYAFQVGAAKKAFKGFNDGLSALYKKSDLHGFLASRQDNRVEDFLKDFCALAIDDSKVALIYESTHTVSIDRM